ncbi:phage integrase SAM-like domain-containing protein [Larkinella terrae]|uniref:Phage integrase SAM-like domain-containing protein n=1 Tax=Larkinella terrae TaxID=2025311 RepID=A0A7K0EK25_9BACT|nr:phage integrase SAM-like domain-containing protein [Larkinella terrae]MRS61826.1 hypothetical protein [Larkinella terrae]
MSYYLLHTLPMRCSFKFRKTRARLLPGQALSGIIEVNIFLKEQGKEKRYGPFSTHFQTTRLAWDRHPLPVNTKPNAVTPEGKPYYNPKLDDHAILKADLEFYRTHFQLAQVMLRDKKKLIAAPFLHQLTLQLMEQEEELSLYRPYGTQTPAYQDRFTAWQTRIENLIETGTVAVERKLVDVFEEYKTFRIKLINDDQYTRTDDEISKKTFENDISQWQLILRYLEANQLVGLLMVSVKPSFLVNFKEWAMNQLVGNTGRKVKASTIALSQTFFGRLCRYAVSKEYIKNDPTSSYTIRTGRTSGAKPLSVETLNQLEDAELEAEDRWIIDSWLVAGELCLHHADYCSLPIMKIHRFKNGIQYINHPRKKQRGTRLKITSEFTPRALRLIRKYGGIAGLYYGTYRDFWETLRRVGKDLGLKDEDGKPIHLVFGLGRDSGMTNRAISGSPARVLKGNAGHSNLLQQEKYINAAPKILEKFLERQALGLSDVDEDLA